MGGKAVCGCGWKSSAKLWIWGEASSWGVRITVPCKTNFGGGRGGWNVAPMFMSSPLFESHAKSNTPASVRPPVHYCSPHAMSVCYFFHYFISSLDCLPCCPHHWLFLFLTLPLPFLFFFPTLPFSDAFCPVGLLTVSVISDPDAYRELLLGYPGNHFLCLLKKMGAMTAFLCCSYRVAILNNIPCIFW